MRRNPREPGSSESRRTPGAFALVGLFSLAFLVRLIHVFQVSDMGFFRQPLSDAAIYLDRARGIVAGDWLGPADFVHAPLYAYVLAAAIAAGDEVWTPRVVQAILGALSCVCVAAAASRLFDARVGVTAGSMLALYPALIFFDGLIQKTNLEVLLASLLLVTCCAAPVRAAPTRPAAREERAARFRPVLRAAIAGVLLGLLAVTRQNALVLAPLVLAWIARHEGGHAEHSEASARPSMALPAGRGARLGVLSNLIACAAGLLIALAPWTVRNAVVLCEFAWSTPNLGQNFAMGNGPGATGTYMEFRPGTGRAESEQREWTRDAARALGRDVTPGEVSDYFLRRSLAWIAEHPSEWLALTASKWLLLWNAYEAFDTEDYYLYQRHAPLIAAFDRVWHFGVLAPLAAAGLVLTARDWRRIWPLYAWIALLAVATTAFVVFARYRAIVLPVLAMFAAAAVVRSIERIRSGQRRRLAAAGACMAGVALVTNWPLAHARRPDAVSHTNHAAALHDAGRLEDALRELREALRLSPRHAYANLLAANVLVKAGRYAEALPHAQAAVAAAADLPAARRSVGDALLGLNRLDEAAEAYRAALRLDDEDHRALNLLAATLARSGRVEVALPLFERAIRLAPEYADAHLNLGNALLVAGRLGEAEAAYARALALRPRTPEALYNLAEVALAQGEVQRARSLLRAACEADAAFEPARRRLEELERSGP